MLSFTKLLFISLICVILKPVADGNVINLTFDSENDNFIESTDNKLEVYNAATRNDGIKSHNGIIERIIDDGNGNMHTIPDQTKVQQTIRYTLGHRSSIDKLVAQSANNYRYNSLMNIVLKLCYPTSGVGAILTYAEIVVEQLSNIGRAYTISGGIGQRNLCVAIEANATNFLSYRASFYGY